MLPIKPLPFHEMLRLVQIERTSLSSSLERLSKYTNRRVSDFTTPTKGCQLRPARINSFAAIIHWEDKDQNRKTSGLICTAYLTYVVKPKNPTSRNNLNPQEDTKSKSTTAHLSQKWKKWNHSDSFYRKRSLLSYPCDETQKNHSEREQNNYTETNQILSVNQVEEDNWITNQ